MIFFYCVLVTIITSADARQVRFAMYDQQRRLERKDQRRVAVGETDLGFDISSLPQGVYFLRCSDGAASKSVRVMKVPK
jgi:hypothetical protein